VRCVTRIFLDWLGDQKNKQRQKVTNDSIVNVTPNEKKEEWLQDSPTTKQLSDRLKFDPGKSHGNDISYLIVG
jgi:hypothetical protein